MAALTTKEMHALLNDPSMWAKFVTVLNSTVAAHGVFVDDEDPVTFDAHEGLGFAGAMWDAAAACSEFVNAVDAARGRKTGGGIT